MATSSVQPDWRVIFILSSCSLIVALYANTKFCFLLNESAVSMKFRNYLPHDKQLQDGRLAAPVLPKFEDPIAVAPSQEENKEVICDRLKLLPFPLQTFLNKLFSRCCFPLQDPFLNIAPKKPNWDLRRDVQKKLDKLEHRTQKAVFQLMRKSKVYIVYLT